MVKHTQTIRRQTADELFECVWLFCEIGAKRDKGLNKNMHFIVDLLFGFVAIMLFILFQKTNVEDSAKRKINLPRKCQYFFLNLSVISCGLA